MSFIELHEFIIYQRLNKRTKILSLATSQIAHLCNQFNRVYQKWSRGHKARSQGQGHKKTFEAKAKDRPSRGQGQGPRTQTQVFSKKNGLQKFFSGDLYLKKPKKVFADFPQGFWRFPTKFQPFKNSAVLEQRTGQFSRT